MNKKRKKHHKKISIKFNIFSIILQKVYIENKTIQNEPPHRRDGSLKSCSCFFEFIIGIASIETIEPEKWYPIKIVANGLHKLEWWVCALFTKKQCLWNWWKTFKLSGMKLRKRNPFFSFERRVFPSLWRKVFVASILAKQKEITYLYVNKLIGYGTRDII